MFSTGTADLLIRMSKGVVLSKCSVETVRNHRNVVRDPSESLSAMGRNLQHAGCHCANGPGHGPKRYLSTVARTGERPRLGYVPNPAYPQVAEFLATYRRLQEMLNEICAINAELLRRRESLN